LATLLRVPEVAAGATEVVVSEWLINEGAGLTAGEPVVTLETDKAQVEVEAEASGVLLRRFVEAGGSIAVGAPLMLVGADTDVDVDALLAELGVPGPARADDGARVFATPLSRRLLAEAGIDLRDVTGSGPNGRITKSDAQQAMARRAATAPEPRSDVAPPAAKPQIAPTQAPPGPNGVPHSRQRRAVAARLSMSKQTVPHFYLKRAVRIDSLLALRADLNELSPQRISVNDLVIRAVAVAYTAVPAANVIWTDEAMRVLDTVDVGVAVASDRGLVTPVLRSVEAITPSAFAARVHEFVHTANAGKLAQRDLEGGTITVTNLGMYGIEEFAAIINPPQSAILAVGAGTPQPVVSDGSLDVATVMNLVLSVDHRAIDGALAAQWMSALVAILEKPLRLLA
jgi:pyruvate dehydrogenase E2 component (dihydrolipoamide acetyltransferase)